MCVCVCVHVCQQYASSMCLTNTCAHKRIHQATWYPLALVSHPASRTIHFGEAEDDVISSYTRVYCRGDIDSDHRLVITSIRLRLCKKLKKRGRQFDVKFLQDASIKADFANTIGKCSDKRKTEGSI